MEGENDPCTGEDIEETYESPVSSDSGGKMSVYTDLDIKDRRIGYRTGYSRLRMRVKNGYFVLQPKKVESKEFETPSWENTSTGENQIDLLFFTVKKKKRE